MVRHISGLRRMATLSLITAAVTVTAAIAGSPAAAAPAEGQILAAGGAYVPGSFVVVLKDAAVASGDVAAQAKNLAGQYAGKVGHVYRHALRGFEVSMSETAAKRLAAHPAVQYVQRNG